MMKLSPRYGDEPVLRMDSLVEDAGTPLLRQRRRLAGIAAGFSDEQWAAQSRCAEWSVQDVIAHLVSTNMFWASSIVAGAGGEPTRFLTEFDPVTSPAQLVAAVRAWTPAETLAKFVKTTEALADAVGALDDVAWDRPAELPLGHVSIRLVALHALWDGWIHERDVLLPLGLEPVEDAEEITAALIYGVGLGPAFLATHGSTREGVLELRATDPDVHVVVDLGANVVIRRGPCPEGTFALTGNAVELLERLSFRVPPTESPGAQDKWLLGSLDVAFDQPII